MSKEPTLLEVMTRRREHLANEYERLKGKRGVNVALGKLREVTHIIRQIEMMGG